MSNSHFRGNEIKFDKYETRNCYPIQTKEATDIIEKQLNELIQCKILSNYCHAILLLAFLRLIISQRYAEVELFFSYEFVQSTS